MCASKTFLEHLDTRFHHFSGSFPYPGRQLMYIPWYRLDPQMFHFGGGVHLEGGSLSSYLSLVRAKLTPRERGGAPPPPPPLRGWSKGKQFSTIPVSPIRKFFRPKVPLMSKVQCSFHTVYENLTPSSRYSRANKKTRGVLEISTLFGGPDPKKRVF